MVGLFLRRPASAAKTAYTSVNTVGNQAWSNEIGKDFDVLSPITITRVGAWDDGGNGFNGSVSIGIFSRATQQLIPGTGPYKITTRDALVGQYRMLRLERPITLLPGQYTIVTQSSTDNFRNNGAGATIKATTASITFGGGRYSTTQTLIYPGSAESNDYDSATFEFIEASAATRTLIVGAASGAVLLAMLEAGAASDGSSAIVTSAASVVEAGASADVIQSTKATSATIAEAGAGIDALATMSSTTAARIDALAAADIASTGVITSASTAEAGAAADATTGVSTAVATQADTLAAADSATTGATTSATAVESGAAVDSVSALSAALASIAEAGTATDLPSAVAALSAGSADAMSAADASSTSGAVTSVSTAEAGSAADNTSGAQQSVAATSENGAVSDNPAATMATTAGRSDALTAADLQQPGGTIITASVAESGAVADFVLASYMLAAQVTEGASASDWLACSFMGVASVSESSPALDITSGRWITSAAVAEALAALEQTTAQLGGQLKPNPRMTYVGRPRIRSITGATRIRSM